MRHRAADGATMTHLRVAHMRGSGSQQRSFGFHEVVVFHIAMAGERADGEMVAAVTDVFEVVHAPHIHDHFGAGQAEAHERNERMPARQELGFVAVLG